MNTVEILGIPFHPLTMIETIAILESFLQTDTNHIVVTPNPEGVMQAKRNPELKEALTTADLSLADGAGIYLAAKIKRKKIPQRVRGVDVTFKLFERLQEKTVYFLGGKPGVAEKAKAEMENKYPNIKVVGLHHGYFDEDAEIIAEINRLSPDILLVCLGMPRQELWAVKNKNINARVTMCVGGTLDIIAGEVQLAPAFFRKIGLEWLYRLFKQPSRFKRQLDLFRFAIKILFHNKESGKPLPKRRPN